MTEKYVVSQEFMNELEEWKQQGNTETYFVGWYDILVLPDDVKRWWTEKSISEIETNNRLIAIIRWANGEDVFEVEKPNKWVVRSIEPNITGTFQYISDIDDDGFIDFDYEEKYAFIFYDKFTALSYCNSYQTPIKLEDK